MIQPELLHVHCVEMIQQTLADTDLVTNQLSRNCRRY